jgi:hypothetical protein
MVHQIRNQLLELFHPIRFLIHMQEARVPGGLPGVVECFRGKLLLAREVALDAPFFKPVASIRAFRELPS